VLQRAFDLKNSRKATIPGEKLSKAEPACNRPAFISPGPDFLLHFFNFTYKKTVDEQSK
jgi:hypothetical protein